MPRGGARPGAGRKPGAAAVKTREAADLIAASGITPLGYMQGVLDGSIEYDEIKFKAAEKAAPYVHARLAAVEHKGEVGVRNVARLPQPARTAEEWTQQHSPHSTH